MLAPCLSSNRAYAVKACHQLSVLALAERVRGGAQCAEMALELRRSQKDGGRKMKQKAL
jgi:hypothetical protein